MVQLLRGDTWISGHLAFSQAVLYESCRYLVSYAAHGYHHRIENFNSNEQPVSIRQKTVVPKILPARKVRASSPTLDSIPQESKHTISMNVSFICASSNFAKTEEATIDASLSCGPPTRALQRHSHE